MHEQRKIVIVGCDGLSNPMYRFHDELGQPDHLRSRSIVDEILAQFPDAKYTTMWFEVVSLSQTARGSGE